MPIGCVIRLTGAVFFHFNTKKAPKNESFFLFFIAKDSKLGDFRVDWAFFAKDHLVTLIEKERERDENHIKP